MNKQVVETFVCPLCGQTVDESLREYHKNLEEWALSTIGEANPDWSGPSGDEKAAQHYRRVVLALGEESAVAHAGQN